MEAATAPSSSAAHAKQYVFVDEYNRHKRLKVMRACDGCRKRKIRCDGALQNGPWPCGACLRLKLKCVPPTLDPDDEHQQSHDTSSSHGQVSFQENVSPQRSNSSSLVPAPPSLAPDWNTTYAASLPSSAAQNNHAVVYDPHAFTQIVGPRLDPGFSDNTHEQWASTTSVLQFPSDDHAPALTRTFTETSETSSGDAQEIEEQVTQLSGAMGDLKIELSSSAAFITNEKQLLADEPAVKEIEVVLPQSVYTDAIVRIPPEMMPSDDRVLDYFGYFFDYIHPYVPVLNKRAFYEQWRTAPHSISPLLLEGLFACVARYLEEPIEIRRWLALASKHEESFKDVPRLSTLQAMVLLMKAREFVPQRGYYFRSWMTVKYMTTMAFDLGFHEHYDNHRLGRVCSLSAEDCMVQTRVWQNIFALEVLIGGSQGRSDFAVERATISLEIPEPNPEIDPFEQQIWRRWTYMIQAFANIKITNEMWQATKRLKKDWALDPAFQRHNHDLVAWYNNLPPDLQMHFPDDGSPPWLGGDHFRAYLHIYHHLVAIMHHRPQLQALLERRDPDFRRHLDILMHSASIMCRVQEALYRDFGMHGLSFMSRGTNFTIYCVLTCTMLHLAAITSPDPVMNSSARLYFTRHMRILEHCLPQAAPHMQAQINALREAFSQNTAQPFELKPTLGLRSPSPETRATPPSAPSSASIITTNPSPWTAQSQPSSKTLSPSSDHSHSYDYVSPSSSISYQPGPYDLPSTSAYAPQSLNAVAHNSYPLQPVTSHEQPVQAPVWDPSSIFHHWNTAFAPQAPPPQPSQPQQQQQQPQPSISPTSVPSHQNVSPGMPTQQPPSDSRAMYSASFSTNNRATLPDSAASVDPMPMVTPIMWQDAFTNAYVSGHGVKRYRDDAMDPGAYGEYKRRG